MQEERGFSLVETLVVVAMTSAFIVFVMASQGSRAPDVHTTALAFEAAVRETRALAMSNAGARASGAMLSVEPAGAGTIVSIYDSRPLVGWAPPTPDAAFPPMHLPASIVLGADAAMPRPFAILISSSGYASIQENYAYDPAHPTTLSADPGCDETTRPTVNITDGFRKETHPLDCRETQYDLTVNS
jgi:type II secretory pathway pseudopilin PulG